jgi:hypothetical protein
MVMVKVAVVDMVIQTTKVAAVVRVTVMMMIMNVVAVKVMHMQRTLMSRTNVAVAMAAANTNKKSRRCAGFFMNAVKLIGLLFLAIRAIFFGALTIQIQAVMS